MKGDLNLGTFAELTETEAEMVEGGSIFSNILDGFYAGITTLSKPFANVGGAVVIVADAIKTAIEAIATPFYSNVLGIKFRD